MTNPMYIPPGGHPIQGLRPPQSLRPIFDGQEVQGKDFKSVLIDSLNEVNRLQTEADAGVQRLLSGESNNVAEVLAAAEKAGIAFDLLMEIRNKLTDAYNEIQQIRV